MLFFKSGAQINNVGPAGSTPLAEAIRVRNLKMVEFLVGLNADIEITNPAFQNGTAVVVAVMLRQKLVVDFLIQVLMAHIFLGF